MGNYVGQTYAATDGEAVTASDTAVLRTTRLVLAGGAGNIAVRYARSQRTHVVPFAAGQALPLQVDQIRSTSTTATGIHVFY